MMKDVHLEFIGITGSTKQHLAGHGLVVVLTRANPSPGGTEQPLQ